MCRYSGVDKTSADCGTGASQTYRIQKNLCVLADWIPFLCQKAVFWIIVMRAGSRLDCMWFRGLSAPMHLGLK